MEQTIYKKDNKGKIRQLKIYTKENFIIQESGLLNGKIVIHKSKTKAKNIGKINATTAKEQAVIEAKAKIIKKLKEGYFKSIKEAEEEEIIMPMLAKVFEKEQDKINWNNAYVQPKLDGMRCLDTINGKLSRKNTPINTMDHIIVNRPGLTEFTIDGELYAHGLSFQENMKIIKKIRPESKNVKYHVYDIISYLPFIDRYTLLKVVVEASDNLELVPTHKVNSLEEVKKYHKLFLSQGYEGTMIRWGNEGYKINRRSSNLLKYKDFLDLACKVIDILPSDKNPKQGIVQCEYKGKTFGCGMKFSHKEREEILTNKKKYIGKMAEIRFFEFTDDDIPRFPICVGFRLDK